MLVLHRDYHGPKSGGDVQDVKITGIPLENPSLAIRLVGVRPPHVMSEARKAVLDKARSFLPTPRRERRQGQNVDSQA